MERQDGVRGNAFFYIVEVIWKLLLSVSNSDLIKINALLLLLFVFWGGWWVPRSMSPNLQPGVFTMIEHCLRAAPFLMQHLNILAHFWTCACMSSQAVPTSLTICCYGKLTAGRLLTRFVELTGELGDPLAEEKPEGLAVVLTFLGIALDTNLAFCNCCRRSWMACGTWCLIFRRKAALWDF